MFRYKYKKKPSSGEIRTPNKTYYVNNTKPPLTYTAGFWTLSVSYQNTSRCVKTQQRKKGKSSAATASENISCVAIDDTFFLYLFRKIKQD